MWGPFMNPATLADRPAVSGSLQRVRIDPEREWVSFRHDRIMREGRLGRQSEIRLPYSNWPTT